MKSIKMKIVLITFSLFLISLNSFSQSKIETIKYFYNLVNESTHITGVDYPGVIKVVEIDAADRISIDSKELGEPWLNNHLFYINNITGLNLDGKRIQIVVQTQCISVNTVSNKKSLVNKTGITLHYVTEVAANEKYTRMGKALTHLAKEYQGKYNYDIFTN